MMIIGDILTPEELERVRQGLGEARFADGRRTARGAAREVKANRQADAADPAVQALARFVGKALERNDLLQLYARPARRSPLMFSRYGPGDAYGLHVDDPVMGAGEEELRTDLSFTLFLSEPEGFEGGELVLDTPAGEQVLKPPAGAVAVYATGVLHRVEPVTSGERLAAVGWIQSRIRRADEREILFDLSRIRSGLGEGEPRLLLDKSIGNLTRLWADI